MEILKWSDDYSIGIQEIDDHHRILIALFNTLRFALLSQDRLDAQKQIIDDIIEHSNSLFAFEEDRMKEVGYPEYSAHKSEHEAFLQKAVNLKEKLDFIDFLSATDTLSFLESWLTDHIRTRDMHYARYLQRK